MATTTTILAGMAFAPQLLAARRSKPKLGLQLYAVRDLFAKDVAGTLREAAKLGFVGVEPWGYGGTKNVYQDYSAKDLRGFLDQNKLKCCGIHMEPKAIDAAHLEQTIECNKVLGNRFLIVAAAKDKMISLKGIRELADSLNSAAEKVRKHKMRVGYHAHGFDFEKIDGRFAWDHLFSQLKPEVIMQIDVGNSLSGGGDPLAMIKKFPGRAASVHVKEYEDKKFAGPYYSEIFQLCESGGTEWYVVEVGDGKSFDAPRQALEELKRLGK